MEESEYTRQRIDMVNRQLKNRGIINPQVIDAFLQVRRHVFIPEESRVYSYNDRPIPIGFDQTISQPYIVAFMTEMLKPEKNMRVLEIGTGSGYQTAILSCLCKEVFSVENIESLSVRAKQRFDEEGFSTIRLKTGDGYYGWNEYAPYDIILVTCAPLDIPAPLTDQLAEGGKLIIPAGDRQNQLLYLIEKSQGLLIQKESIPVKFVPMIHT